MWNKFRRWCIETWHQLDNWQTLVLFVIVCLTIYSPVWVGYLLYFLFHLKWAFAMASAVLAFWAAPFTPFFPICMSITLAIKKFIIHLHHQTVRKVHQMKAKIHRTVQSHTEKKGT